MNVNKKNEEEEVEKNKEMDFVYKQLNETEWWHWPDSFVINLKFVNLIMVIRSISDDFNIPYISTYVELISQKRIVIERKINEIKWNQM